MATKGQRPAAKPKPRKPAAKPKPRKPAAKPRPRPDEVSPILKGKVPLPERADALRGMHRLPGAKTDAPFAGWCIHLGKLRLLEQLAGKHPELLHELGTHGRTMLHAAASKGPDFAKLLLAAGVDPLQADEAGRLPVDVAIKAANKAVTRLLAPVGDLDALVLLDYREFERRVLAGASPRLPTDALTAVLRRARLRVDRRDTSGESRALEATAAASLVGALRAQGARLHAAGAVEVHSFGSPELAAQYFEQGEVSRAEREELVTALSAFDSPKEDESARHFARYLIQTWLAKPRV